MSKSTKLASLLADLDNTAPKDYDPEDVLEPLHDQNDNSEDERDLDETSARDHYVSVGKSKLRNEQPLLDDPRYSGKRTSRKDIYSDSEQDDEIEEQPSDDNDSEEAQDLMNSDDDSNDDDEDLLAKSHTYKNDFEKESDEEVTEDEEEEGEEAEGSQSDADDDVNAELKKIQEEEKQMISQLSKSAQSDVEKGQHVRQQLTLWDNCLENRIRMQKLIDNANKLPQKDNWYDFMGKAEGIEADLESAKNDLRGVIDDLIDIRTDLLTQNGAVDLSDIDFNTRKRHLEDDDEDYLESLWNDISQINDVFVPFRNSTLEKWSNKVQAAAGARLNKKFKAFDQNIMTQIDNALADKPSLIKRTQLQRSDYKVLGKAVISLEEEQQQQGEDAEDTGKKPDRHLNTYDVEIFDDQDFYQQQLRELIESRMVDTDDPLAIGMRWAARKQTEQKKKKKVVNRKGSKGRQLR
ncbi:apoptosis antagonizing transcription factor-domain-containing protein [Choanephora cucurbitarum]|nr:apoptosis antagonizing transcription factor-domain-containing protein [Choanephora cucurbitarum]